MTHSDEYLNYLESEEWKIRREEILERDNHTCVLCNGPAEQVHHKTYAHLGNEYDEELVSVCKACHPLADEMRPATTRYLARVNGWANRVYGPYWRNFRSFSFVEYEFKDWMSYNGYSLKD